MLRPTQEGLPVHERSRSLRRKLFKVSSYDIRCEILGTYRSLHEATRSHTPPKTALQVSPKIQVQHLELTARVSTIVIFFQGELFSHGCSMPIETRPEEVRRLKKLVLIVPSREVVSRGP